MWDVVAERGLARLRAHTDQITGVAFLDRVDALVSTSKDGGLRVWSLTTLHCCQFVPNHVGARCLLYVTCCSNTYSSCTARITC